MKKGYSAGHPKRSSCRSKIARVAQKRTKSKNPTPRATVKVEAKLNAVRRKRDAARRKKK